jgi:hypothetical protein
MTNFT